jgi:predicted DNA-binding transcriptional regulator YafY
MGQRSSTKTVVALFQAFVLRKKWTQGQLARHLDVGVPVVRKHLKELEESGFRLTSRKDVNDVWWTVPPDWYPGAVLFDAKSVRELLRQVLRLPRGKARNELVNRILKAAPKPAIATVEPSAVLTPEPSEMEEMYLPQAEDSMNDKVSLKIHYFTTSRGALDWRHVSVQRVKPDTPARFLAVCHRDGALKWFRCDNVLHAVLDPSFPYRTAEPTEVDAVVRQSVDGFHQGGAVPCSFFVSGAESAWIERNLPCPMTQEATRGGKRFTATTAGVLRLARFVVGLGGAAHAETPELAMLVMTLARGALETASTASSEGEAGPPHPTAGR